MIAIPVSSAGGSDPELLRLARKLIEATNASSGAVFDASEILDLIQENTSDSATNSDLLRLLREVKLRNEQDPRHDNVALTYNGDSNLLKTVKTLRGVVVQVTDMIYNLDGTLANVRIS